MLSLFSWVDVCSLFVFWVGDDVKSYFLVFSQSFEIVVLDGREVSEEIFVVFRWGNKIKIFGVVELFNGIICYLKFFWKKLMGFYLK